MPITASPPPRNARAAVLAAIRKLRPKTRYIPSLGRGSKFCAPLPVYRIAAKGAHASNPLAFARRVGWRYPIVGARVAGLLLLAERRGEFHFGGLFEGHVAESLLGAASFAEHALEDSRLDYAARLLDIPSLQLCLLWLHSARRESRFVCFVGRFAQDLEMEDSVKAIIDRAESATKGRTPPRRAKRP